MRTPDFDLTPAQVADAERIYEILREATEDDHWRMAQLLASKRDDQLFGPTEYEVRDLTHKAGAKAIQAALDGRKKGDTKGRA
jgi:hypothetical protein